eukprot:Em0011g57a
MVSSAHSIGYHSNRAGSSIVKAEHCSDLVWPAATSERPENGGFVIKSTITSEWGGRYTPKHSYNLDLVGLVNPFEGFIIQARDRWNEGLILGSFIPLDTSKAQTIHCLGNDHGTVTHNSKDPVSVQSFIWQAPPTLEGSGEVDFVYLVMQSFSTPQLWIKSISPSHDMREKNAAHMMVARHTHDPAADPTMDNATDNATGADAVDVEHITLIRVHCVLMIVAFSIFGPIGIFFGSWMRPVMSQKGLWFQAGDDAHFALGFLVVILLIANPLISIFRCQPKDPNRWIYNLIHGVLVGVPFQIIVLADSCVGVYLIGGEGPMLWIFLAFAGFTILMNTGQGIITFLVLGRDADLPAPARLLLQFLKKEDHVKTDPPKEEVIELEKSNEAPVAHSTKELVLRWVGLTIYIAVSIPLLIAVIVLVCMSSPD